MSSTIEIIESFSPSDFDAFGSIIERPAEAGQRQFYSDWLGGQGLAPMLHVNNVPQANLPLMLNRLERHPHAAQCFVPLDVSRYLVSVAPPLPSGAPDLSGMKTFLLPGTVGVIYARGIWHAGASVLDRAGAFAVLMWRGANDDDVFVDIEPTQITSRGLRA